MNKIAEGIPRSYPCHKALFLFGEIGWADNTYNEFSLDSDSIMLINDWWMPKRARFLRAEVSSLIPVVEGAGVKSLSEQVKKSLSSLGKIKKNSLQFSFSLEEQSILEELNKKGRKIIENNYIKNMVAISNKVMFPYG
ncbi:hypothetical protein J5Y03_09265 [Bacillus sp. RG28]|uniref:Uncharacterized protein n=1 Tax=Gottfriedia endophytica TaxID=2820819 RepID=A0A940SIV2_9BACI|nr:hypothetical protein [Gottfriedia endophytica]MBP0725375.1 hypothetical protein [Gottfriedia endophytica]